MAKDTFLNRKTTVNLKGRLLDLSTPTVMGILNITPDSFYQGSRSATVEDALRRTEAFLHEGATFIDIGAYSSRPGATDISEEEELMRLIPVIEAIRKKLPEAVISLDTFRSRVAREGISAGGHIVNDISGGSLDEAMFETVADLQIPYILMHMKGSPQTMLRMATYDNIGLEITEYFQSKIAALRSLGVKDIIIDPGFGFAKTPAQSYQLLNQLQDLQLFELPVLVGVSRKSMIHKFLGITAEDALNGTTVLNTIALLKGASILRVHDVKAAAECIALVQKTLTCQ
jgi:dihydropteroate synthase